MGYNTEHLTLEEMVEEIRGTTTALGIIARWITSGETLEWNDVNAENMGLWLSLISRWLYSRSQSITTITDFSLVQQVAGSILYFWGDQIPVWDSDTLPGKFRKYLSFGNEKLPDVLSVATVEGLLDKYGLPSHLISFTGTQWTPADFDQLEDFLVDTYSTETETNSTSGDESTDKTNTASQTSSSNSSGKDWKRTRPINYTTTDETTADEVNGDSSENSSTTSGEGTGTEKWTGTSSGTREKILQERHTALLSFMRDLQGVLTPWITELVQSLAPCFVQEFAV